MGIAYKGMGTAVPWLAPFFNAEKIFRATAILRQAISGHHHHSVIIPRYSPTPDSTSNNTFSLTECHSCTLPRRRSYLLLDF